MLSTNLTELNQLINDYEKNPVFRTDFSTTGEQNNLTDIGAVAKIGNMPWKVVYLRTDFSDEELRREQRKLTTLVATVIAAIVGLLAVGAAHLLSYPITAINQYSHAYFKR